MIIGLLGLLGFFICLVMLIIALIRKKPKKKLAIGMVVCFVAFTVGLGSSDGESSNSASTENTNQQSQSTEPEPPAPEPEPEPEPEIEYIEVTATKLLADYDENAIAADNTYKDQLVMVTGTVGNIDKDITGSPYVTLKNDDNQWSIMSVQCYFKRNNTDGIATLKEGDIITIVGKCSGKSLNVAVKDCELVE